MGAHNYHAHRPMSGERGEQREGGASLGVEQRLEFIEFRLFWEGHVNRSDVMQQFGLSVNQASADLNRYLGFAPDNMVYDKSARTSLRANKSETFDSLKFTLEGAGERSDGSARTSAHALACRA